MFHFPDDRQSHDGQDASGSVLAARIMAAQYNLAVQSQGPAKATPAGILSQILGEWLQERADR